MTSRTPEQISDALIGTLIDPMISHKTARILLVAAVEEARRDSFAVSAE